MKSCFKGFIIGFLAVFAVALIAGLAKADIVLEVTEGIGGSSPLGAVCIENVGDSTNFVITAYVENINSFSFENLGYNVEDIMELSDTGASVEFNENSFFVDFNEVTTGQAMFSIDLGLPAYSFVEAFQDSDLEIFNDTVSFVGNNIENNVNHDGFCALAVSTAVPEPSSGLLFSLTGLMFLRRRR